jgi:predicted DNA-binding transcriptional regulator AlpA
MEALYIPNENDLKRWVKEAVQEYFELMTSLNQDNDEKYNVLIGRKDVAKLLQVSLVTLTDWMKRGLPYHKQRGRVYFLKSEILEYIQKNDSNKARLLSAVSAFGG